MILGGEADGIIGAEINLNSNLRADKVLFSESSGFVFEANNKNIEKIKSIFDKYNIKLTNIGKTTDSKSLTMNKDDKKIINLPIEEMKKAWTTGLIEALEWK